MLEFKSLNGYYVKDETARNELDKRMVRPSGDETGVTDRIIIEARLAEGVCNLGPGTFYTDRPITVGTGYVITGQGNVATKIICKAGFVKSAEAGADHLTFRDFAVYGEALETAFNLRNASYSRINNVDVWSFGKGIVLYSTWCAHLDHVRFTCGDVCVSQHGTCNNNVYDHCQFLGSGSSTGVVIDAEDGSENYGHTFRNCDWERHAIGLRAYACNALTVRDVYSEAVSTMFNVDSCHGFLVDGGYLSYITRLANVSRSNTMDFYTGCQGKIRNIFATTGVTEDTYLITADASFVVDVENVTAINRAGNYKVWYFSRDLDQGYATGGNYPRHYITGNQFICGSTATYNTPYDVPLKNSESCKLIMCQLEVQAEFQSTTTGTIKVQNEKGTAWTFTVFANNTYHKGDLINGTPTVGNLITDNLRGYKVAVYPTTSVEAPVKPKYTIAVGEMLAQKGAQ